MTKRVFLLVGFFISVISFLTCIVYIKASAPRLINYWGRDLLAEIYQTSYSFDKFIIQLSFVSLSVSFYFLILFIFNTKNKFLVWSILIVSVLIFFFFHLMFKAALTDTGYFDLGSYQLRN